MTSVSIIIVTYNSEDEINDCLISILSQFTGIDLEIIITDNNSSDNTINIIQSFNSQKITLIPNSKNVGFTKAINQCLENVSMENILILNPDTIVPNDSLKHLLNTLDVDDSPGIVAPQLKYPNGVIQYSCRRFPRRRDIIYESFGLSKLFRNSKEFGYWKMTDFDHTESRMVEQPAGAALIMKKKLIDKIGHFDEKFPMFFSDVDFCRRVIEHGYDIMFNSNISIVHKGGSSVLKNRSKMIISSHLSFYKYFKKYSKSFIDYMFDSLIGLFLLIIIPIRLIINLLLPTSLRKCRNTL